VKDEELQNLKGESEALKLHAYRVGIWINVPSSGITKAVRCFHREDVSFVLFQKRTTLLRGLSGLWAEAAVFYGRELLVNAGFASAWRQIVEPLCLSHNRRVIRKICDCESWDRD
jgi:hypothetical protein